MKKRPAQSGRFLQRDVMRGDHGSGCYPDPDAPALDFLSRYIV